MGYRLKFSPSSNVSDFFFFNDTATTEIYTLSLHDALPILTVIVGLSFSHGWKRNRPGITPRSEEHTSELQSRSDLVCRLLLEKKNTQCAGTGRGGTRTSAGRHGAGHWPR